MSCTGVRMRDTCRRTATGELSWGCLTCEGHRPSRISSQSGPERLPLSVGGLQANQLQSLDTTTHTDRYTAHMVQTHTDKQPLTNEKRVSAHELVQLTLLCRDEVHKHILCFVWIWEQKGFSSVPMKLNDVRGVPVSVQGNHHLMLSHWGLDSFCADLRVWFFSCLLVGSSCWLCCFNVSVKRSKVRLTNTHLLQPFYLEAAAVAEGALPLRRLTARRLWKQRNTHGYCKDTKQLQTTNADETHTQKTGREWHETRNSPQRHKRKLKNGIKIHKISTNQLQNDAKWPEIVTERCNNHKMFKNNYKKYLNKQHEWTMRSQRV